MTPLRLSMNDGENVIKSVEAGGGGQKPSRRITILLIENFELAWYSGHTCCIIQYTTQYQTVTDIFYKTEIVDNDL